MFKFRFLVIALVFFGFHVKSQILAGDSIGSAIYYHNLGNLFIGCSSYCGPSHVSQASDSLDINQDGIYDFKFIQYNASGPGGCGFYEDLGILNTNMEVIVLSANTSYIDTIAAGSVIDKNGAWSFSTQKTFHDWSILSGNPSTSYGVFDNQQRYLGFRLKETYDTLYGWLKISLQGTSSNVQGINLTSYAMNKPINQIADYFPIQQIAIFPSPTSDYIKIMGDFESSTLLDILGGEILSTNEKTINVTYLPTGVYFVRIKTRNGLLVKKIVVQN